jgi:hypothetical protein
MFIASRYGAHVVWSNASMSSPPAPSDRRSAALALAVVAFITFLPFARGVLAGDCFFWRDLAQHFLPLRLFAVEGLMAGEVRHWNPYAHEGELLPLPTLSYPLDLLHVLWPSVRGLSLLLALHVPLAGLGFLTLARRLALSWRAAVGGALAYALGGFCLSSLSLYVHLQGIAWAPFVVAGLIGAARGGRRHCAIAAIVTAIAVSTVAVEITAQAVLVGLTIGLPGAGRRGVMRVASALLLAAALIAPTAAHVRQLLQDSGRQGATPVEVVLQYSLHPVMLLQVAAAGLFGDTARQVDEYAGYRFVGAFPYFSSLYLGVVVLALSAVGARYGRALRVRLVVLVLLGLVVSLGAWARLDLLLQVVPAALRVFRYPCKAFFTAHLAIAILAALGIEALGRDPEARPWRLLAAIAGGVGGLLVAGTAFLAARPATLASLGASFFPAAWPAERQAPAALMILGDARLGGLVAVTVAVIAALVVARRLNPGRAVLACIALMAADLLRGGAGLNPMVTASFYDLSPEMSRVAARLREDGGRLFSCEPEFSDHWRAASQSMREGQDAWINATYLEALVAYDNVLARVPSAYSLDQTAFTPLWRLMSAADVSCDSLSRIVDRLRAAGVTHIISYSPREHPALRIEEVLRPPRVAPLALYLYALAEPLPRLAVARRVQLARDRSDAVQQSRLPGFQASGGVAVEGDTAFAGEANGTIVSHTESADRVEVAVDTDRPSVLVVRDAWAPGWAATVDGAAVPIWRADGRHRAVPVPAGRSRVVLSYRLPHMGLAYLVASIAAGIVLLLARAGRAGVLD